MTEEEAKTKWCPFVRAVWDYHEDEKPPIGPFNRDLMVEDSGNMDDYISRSLCIGSACMAWRETFEPGQVDGDFDPRAIIRLQKSGGFCGLAGKQ